MTFWKKRNYGDTKKITGCQGGGIRNEQVNTGDFKSYEASLYGAIMVDM